MTIAWREQLVTALTDAVTQDRLLLTYIHAPG